MEKDIGRANLERHKIFYDPNVYQGNDANSEPTANSLPDHVDAVRAGLLFMQKIVPEDWSVTLRDELARHRSAAIGPDWCLYPQESAFTRCKHLERMRQQSPLDDNLTFCEDVVEGAKEMKDNSEDEWTFFWRCKFFRLFSDEVRAHSGFNPSLDAWSLYENVEWNEFDKFAKPCSGSAHRTRPKPDLTYAFPIQTATPDSLEGFARDELAQTLSLQSLGKLAEQGVVCAPTTALRNRANLPDRSEWSSSDRSCFPWAIVEMKKDVTSPHHVAVERCYCQAANAAAAALDIQAQLFGKLNDTSSLQPPPVVAFTCVGPVVKVWLAYHDRSTIFGPPVQRMICIWSTSVRLTWGVASLRAIIKNMHTWSSRLLKPRLQVAISQVSQARPVNNLFDFQRPPIRFPPIPTVTIPEAIPANNSSTLLCTSSRKTPDIVQVSSKVMTPERHNTPVAHTRIDTPTPSKNTDQKSLLHNSQPKEALETRKDSIFGTNKSAIVVGSTTRTHGLLGQVTSTGTLGTTAGFGLRYQSATRNGSLFGGASIGAAREPGQSSSGSDPGSKCIEASHLVSSNLATSLFGAHGNNKKRTPSISSTQLESSSRITRYVGESSTGGSLPKPASATPSEPVFGTLCKLDSSASADNRDSDRGGLFVVFKTSNNTASSNTGRTYSSSPIKEADICDITTAFASTSLRGVVRSHSNGSEPDKSPDGSKAQDSKIDLGGSSRMRKPGTNNLREAVINHPSSETRNGFKPTHRAGSNATTNQTDRHLDNNCTNPGKDSNWNEFSDSWRGTSFLREFVRFRTKKHQCISMSLCKRMISDLEEEHRRILVGRFISYMIEYDLALGMPLRVVVREFNQFAKPADRIPFPRRIARDT